MASNGPSSTKQRSSGRGCFFFILILLLFGLGFYTGVRATKRVTAVGPAWAQRLLGVPPAPVTAAATPPTTPATTPTTVATSAPVSAPPANPAPATSPGTSPAPGTATSPNTSTGQEQANASPTQPGTSGASNPPGDETTSPEQTEPPTRKLPPSPSASAPPSDDSSADVTSLVEEYNNALHRIQQSAHTYETVHKKATDSKTKPQDLQALLDQQNTLLDEMRAAAQRAQTLQTTLKSRPQFTSQYEEGKPCLPPEKVPTTLLNLGLEKLRFVQLTPHRNTAGP